MIIHRLISRLQSWRYPKWQAIRFSNFKGSYVICHNSDRVSMMNNGDLVVLTKRPEKVKVSFNVKADDADIAARSLARKHESAYGAAP